MALYGVDWQGILLHDMALHGYGIVLHGVSLHCMEWRGMVLHGIVVMMLNGMATDCIA
jgi:hypothetical protein